MRDIRRGQTKSNKSHESSPWLDFIIVQRYDDSSESLWCVMRCFVLCLVTSSYCYTSINSKIPMVPSASFTVNVRIRMMIVASEQRDVEKKRKEKMCHASGRHHSLTAWENFNFKYYYPHFLVTWHHHLSSQEPIRVTHFSHSFVSALPFTFTYYYYS